MANLVLVLFALALFHFIYDGIIAPSIRMNLRYRLFKLRDELRALKSLRGAEIDTELYEFAEGSLNSTVKYLHRIDAGMAFSAWNAIQHDEGLRNRSEHINQLFDACSVEEVKKIRHKTLEVINYALLTNLGAWGLYLTPVALALLAYSGIASAVKKALSLPETDVDRIIPTDRYVNV